MNLTQKLKPFVLEQKTRWLGDHAGLFANLVYILTASIFLPFTLTMLTAILLTAYILINPVCRRQLLATRALLYCCPFYAVCLITPLFYGNWVGFLCAFAIIIISILFVFMRQVITRIIYERALNFVLLLSVAVSSCGLLQMLVSGKLMHDPGFRAHAVFFNPNYFGTVAVYALIICAYKFFAFRQGRLLYMLAAVFNLISIYISGSMSSMLAVAVGIMVILIAMKKYKLLVMALFCLAGGVLLLALFPAVLPRLTLVRDTGKARLIIWQASLLQITRTPFFGQGALTYMNISRYMNYKSQHAHNLFIEPILSYGIVGTLLLAVNLVRYYANVLEHYLSRVTSGISVLIIALTAAIVTHGMTDVTLFWIQTGLLAALILSGEGIGSRERHRQARNKS